MTLCLAWAVCFNTNTSVWRQLNLFSNAEYKKKHNKFLFRGFFSLKRGARIGGIKKTVVVAFDLIIVEDRI